MHCTPPNGNSFITSSNTPNYCPPSTINADFSHLLWFCLPHVWSFLGSSTPRITLIFLFGVKGDPSAFPSLAIVLRVQSKSARHPVQWTKDDPLDLSTQKSTTSSWTMVPVQSQISMHFIYMVMQIKGEFACNRMSFCQLFLIKYPFSCSGQARAVHLLLQFDRLIFAEFYIATANTTTWHA